MNKIICFFLLSCTFCKTSFTQTANQDILDSFSGKFITTIRAHERQKAYLVTDRDVFKPGEYVWFRAFLLNAVSQKINAKSRFLFADLVDEKDSVINFSVLDAYNKQLDSRMRLPDSLPAGYYWLRAYTGQMIRDDTNGIYVKSIYVFDGSNNDSRDKPEKQPANQENTPRLTFYPEGGSIMTGINSTVAVKATLENGEPLSIAGYITDTRGTDIKFVTNKYGLGKFDFEPSGYRKYKAVINWHGKDIEYPLPSFNYYTGQLSITKEFNAYKLRVLLGDSIYSKDLPTYVVGVAKDSLFFAAIGKGQYEIPVSERKLPEGIATFYLFDKDFKLLSERTVYSHGKDLRIAMSTDKPVYGRREKVTLTIAVTDAELRPVPSMIAVSVTDSIFSGLYQQRPATGNFNRQQEPDNFSLAANNALSDEETDLLMLTKSNTYHTTHSNDSRQQPHDDTDSILYIKGMVTNEKNEPAAGKVLSLLSNSGNLVFNSDTTDNAGRFCFPLDYYTDSTQFVLEVRNLNGLTEKNKIWVDTFIYPRLKTPVALKQYYTSETKPAGQNFSNYYRAKYTELNQGQLPPVTVKDQKNAADYDVSKRVSPNSAILSAKDLDERTRVGNTVLRVAGTQIIGGYLVIGGLTSMSGVSAASEPMLLVDGVQVTTTAGLEDSSPVLAYLNGLNPKDIDFIEILKGSEGANYGVRGGHGVILVNMLSRRREMDLDNTNLKIFFAKGIANPVLFPSTDYQVKEVKNKTISDHRTNLFWNGSFLTGEDSSSALTFYTNDIPATYAVTVTGITKRGDIILKTISFQTK